MKPAPAPGQLGKLAQRTLAALRLTPRTDAELIQNLRRSHRWLLLGFLAAVLLLQFLLPFWMIVQMGDSVVHARSDSLVMVMAVPMMIVGVAVGLVVAVAAMGAGFRLAEMFSRRENELLLRLWRAHGGSSRQQKLIEGISQRRKRKWRLVLVCVGLAIALYFIQWLIAVGMIEMWMGAGPLVQEPALLWALIGPSAGFLMGFACGALWGISVVALRWLTRLYRRQRLLLELWDRDSATSGNRG